MLSNSTIIILKCEQVPAVGFFKIRQKGTEKVSWYVIPKSSRLTLGRETKNDIVVKDPLLSRTHLVIFSDAVHAYLKPSRVTNGTRLNDHIVGEQCLLRKGDQIGIGNIVIEYFPLPTPRFLSSD
jgi:hypothetical protein